MCKYCSDWHIDWWTKPMYNRRRATHVILRHLITGVACLCSVFFADANSALVTQAVGPKSVNVEGTDEMVSLTLGSKPMSGWYIHSRSAVMRNEQPITENTLGEDIVDGKEDGLDINVDFQRQSSSSEGPIPC